jgi:thiamine-phosphate pyrophosphorylase
VFELLLITDPAAPGGIVASVRAALPGADARCAVQLRAKALGPPALLPIARELRAITRDAGLSLLINGSLEIAQAVDADGLHLPESGISPIAARAALGPRALLGVSCHDPAGLARAADGGADYATLSPVFDSPNKGPALGIERFSAWTSAARLPVFALGGVKARHAPQLKAAGARGLAVISAVFGAPDPAAAVHELLSRA